ncbi:hypothetical protein V494_08047 [Pseudogymnoascus sp. VKM F-4513 (FW-928)]|nr:hypothetical protein V494_08047 [Pseudogymnoascus sp. VKM F-4513 (FW-928)]
MVQKLELPLRHPKKPVPRPRRPHNLRIPKRHHSKLHISQPPDLTPPNKLPSSSPQPESLSTQPPDGTSTEGLPSPWVLATGTTFQPSLDATSLTSRQPQVQQGDTANTHCSNEDEGFISAPESDYSDCDLEYEGEYENGRVYCPGRKYHFPIDKKQRETAEFMMHLMWKKYSQVWQESLNIQKLQNVLDIGPGACYWADDFALENPQAIVIGVDLFPSKEKHDRNVQLIKEDVEEPWLARDKYDFVHSRDMALAIRDWDKLLNRAFRSLKSGGSIAVQEIHFSPQSKDGGLHSTAQPLANFFSEIAKGLRVLHIDLHAVTSLAAKMHAIGFENVTTKISYITISHDTQDSADKTAMWMRGAIYEGLQGTALGPLTRGLGLDRMQVEVSLVGVRDCLRSGLQDTRLPIYTIHAQRP